MSEKEYYLSLIENMPEFIKREFQRAIDAKDTKRLKLLNDMWLTQVKKWQTAD